jgi:hypothetical protein
VWQVQQFAPVPEIDEDAAPLLFGGCNCTKYAAGGVETPTAWPDAASAPLNGWLDAVRVWSRALAPHEIARLARSAPADTRMNAEKVLSIVTLCTKCSMALTFQNFFFRRGALAAFGAPVANAGCCCSLQQTLIITTIR